MKKHWLRGVLLGASLALLLSGGVALALVTLSVDQECFECWPAAAAGPDDEHVVLVTLEDYDDELDLCRSLEFNPELVWELGCIPEESVADPPCEMSLWVDCQNMGLYMEDTCYGAAPRAGWPAEAGPAFVPVVEYGDWVLRVWQDQEEPVEVDLTFAEDCAALEEEFVAEPGTLMLLGSGLMGLAGYATLRWRARG
jgi:hypothetical protein